MLRLFACLSFAAIAACGGEPASDAAPVADASKQREVPAQLRDATEDFIAACTGAHEKYGDLVDAAECRCVGEGIGAWLPAAAAEKFFIRVIPYYDIPVDNRRGNFVDQAFRDAILQASPEERDGWNTLIAEIFPVCRSLNAAAGDNED